MSIKQEKLKQQLEKSLGKRCQLTLMRDEIRLDVASPSDYHAVMLLLRDTPELSFDELIDLCGVDYSSYGGNNAENRPACRFAVVTQLLSIPHNWRLRVRVFAQEEALPTLASVTDIWTCANWYEREAFDLLGILFEGHPDLRRLLTDYGFVGHPFRKDFPACGHVEMRYDPEEKRVVYQPITSVHHENTPRIRREAAYGAGSHQDNEKGAP